MARESCWAQASDNLHAHLSFWSCASEGIFIFPSEQLFVWLIHSLSGTAVQRWHQLAVEFVIQEERSSLPTVHVPWKEKFLEKLFWNHIQKLPTGHILRWRVYEEKYTIHMPLKWDAEKKILHLLFFTFLQREQSYSFLHFNISVSVYNYIVWGKSLWF